MDEGAEEKTRRVAFQPSFAPMPSFEPAVVKAPPAAVTKMPPAAPVREGTWKLPAVPVLPKFHPLEQTAVFVPHSIPKEVSMRISEVLRERSIEATFDNEKAKVSCVTPDGVDFRVRLYGGRGEFDHGIIVEVQRRFGTSSVFYEDTKAILDAAEGKVPPPPPSLGGSLPMVTEEHSSPVNASSSLSMVSEMLNQPGHDTTFLALQMLSSLTDSSKMGAGTAKTISEELLRLDDSNEIAGNVFSLLMDESGDGDAYKLRSLTFQAVANAFQSVNGNVSTLLQEQLSPLVIQALRDAEKSPRVAYQAARMASFLTSNELRLPLRNALEVGKARHSALECQARMCLTKLG